MALGLGRTGAGGACIRPRAGLEELRERVLGFLDSGWMRDKGLREEAQKEKTGLREVNGLRQGEKGERKGLKEEVKG